MIRVQNIKDTSLPFDNLDFHHPPPEHSLSTPIRACYSPTSGTHSTPLATRDSSIRPSAPLHNPSICLSENVPLLSATRSYRKLRTHTLTLRPRLLTSAPTLKMTDTQIKFEQSPADSLAESFVSSPGTIYPSLFSTDTIDPSDVLTPPFDEEDDIFAGSRSASVSETPAPEKKPTKKRKSWGQQLPEPKTNLPPRYVVSRKLLNGCFRMLTMIQEACQD